MMHPHVLTIREHDAMSEWHHAEVRALVKLLN
jgi:hypothetical protein